MDDPHDRALTLDGIRGIAAIAVLLFHCGLHLEAPGLVGHGSLAVDVFFCMSGYVVERAYGARLRSGWPAAAFARARVRRLYPLYALGLGLGTLLHAATHLWQGRPVPVEGLAMGVLIGMLLIPCLSDAADQVFPLNGPSWSLLIEACANAGFAALPKRFGTPLIVVAVAVSGATLSAAAVSHLDLTVGGRAGTLWLDLARGGFGFGVGVLMKRLESRPAFGAVPRLPAPLVLAALALLLLVPRTASDAWFDPLAMLLLCPVLVALGVASRPSPATGRWCARAGAVSYPLYVVHAPIVDAAATLGSAASGAPATRVLALGVAAALALALAVAIGRRREGSAGRIATPAVSGDPMPVLTAVRARG